MELKFNRHSRIVAVEMGVCQCWSAKIFWNQMCPSHGAIYIKTYFDQGIAWVLKATRNIQHKKVVLAPTSAAVLYWRIPVHQCNALATEKKEQILD